MLDTLAGKSKGVVQYCVYMVSPEIDGYIGVDTRHYPAAATQNDLVVLAWSCDGVGGYGRYGRLPLTQATAAQLRDDLDALLDEMTDCDCPECGGPMQSEFEREHEGWTTWTCTDCGEQRHAEGKYE